MSNIPLPQQIYKHFKGNFYRIVTLAQHSETGEKLVIYQAMYGDHTVYARPLSMFCEKVDKEKYPEVQQEYRFALQQDWSDQSIEQQDEAKQNWEQAGTASGEAGETDNEEFSIDPLVMEFLDADTYEQRLNILAALHHRVTDEMITTMALAVDVEVSDKDTEERFEELRNCLLTFEKYEGSRLR